MMPSFPTMRKYILFAKSDKAHMLAHVIIWQSALLKPHRPDPFIFRASAFSDWSLQPCLSSPEAVPNKWSFPFIRRMVLNYPFFYNTNILTPDVLLGFQKLPDFFDPEAAHIAFTPFDWLKDCKTACLTGKASVHSLQPWNLQSYPKLFKNSSLGY